MSQIRKRVIVEGRVQGVFFRDSTRRRARELGLSGFVRNLPDGGVEAVFEGEPSAVAEAVTWIRRGPPYARVRHVEIRDEEPSGELSGFTIE